MYARWTVKYSKAKQPTETPTPAATRQHDIAIPMLGYKNHAGIDRAHGFTPLNPWLFEACYDPANSFAKAINKR
ncbi:hypothetical protein B5P46_01270 [Rhizobium leguminosarum]|uniref:Uncharacterized protein n=1 Tax=Rhizobium leguminosarum TaxID=384 RepID=A0A4Q1UES8_RHILE|nr:hypothetical protein B5P46_01270 [Rhizobium leguminosarum]